MTCELTEVVTLVFAWMMNQRWILGLESSRAIVRDPGFVGITKVERRTSSAVVRGRKRVAARETRG